MPPELPYGAGSGPKSCHTRNVFYLDDGEIAEIKQDSYTVKHIEHDQKIIKEIKEIEHSLEQIEKGNYYANNRRIILSYFINI